MITGISIENFKGIRERVDVELRPLTLLFGANSAGKSSIIQALNYAREVFVGHNLDADTTEAGGDTVDLGGFSNFIHGRDTSRPLVLRFELDIERKLLYPSVDVFDAMSAYLMVPVLDQLSKDISKAVITVEVGHNEFLQRVSVRRFQVELDGVLFAEIAHNPDRNATGITQLNDAHPALHTPRDVAYFDPEDIDTEGLEAYGDPSRSLLSSSLEYVRELFTFTGDGSIPLSGLSDALPNFDATLRIHSDREQSTRPKQEMIQQEGVLDDVRFGLTQLIVGPGRLLRDWLLEFRYLGPIRTMPPRGYTPPKTANPSRWASGLGAWDRLSEASDETVEEVSHWLGDQSCLNSGYRIKKKRFKELDLSDPLVVRLLTGRAFDDVDSDAKIELDRVPAKSRVTIVSNDNGVELLPSDVGIGISQVVPVIVTALDGSEMMIAIEQPELHLHPKLQAELADLFIEAAKGPTDHTVILETHSELIPLRFMRRIRETIEQRSEGRPELAAEDVAIYYVELFKGATVVTRLNLSERGQLLDPWPDGFFEEGYRERFAD